MKLLVAQVEIVRDFLSCMTLRGQADVDLGFLEDWRSL